MTRTYIGVDLSKDWADVFDPRSGARRVANTAQALGAWLDGLERDDLVVFEATSFCDGPILRVATAAGQPFHRLNPLHGWHFARSLNLPKTDRVDARMLARLGAERRLEPSPGFDPARAELAELWGRRDQLKRMQTQEKNRLARTRSAPVEADIEALLRHLARRIARIEAEIAAFRVRRPEIDRKARLLETLPGVGPATSTALIAHMPELGALDRRAAASLGGLAPRARESGGWRGRRHTGDGRRHVRRALYMAALGAMRGAGPLAAFVQRLRANGKPGKVIVIAVARKLLTIANAILRDGVPFRTKPAA